jgi:ferredoxin-fold anticodon binding domain-containing protein
MVVCWFCIGTNAYAEAAPGFSSTKLTGDEVEVSGNKYPVSIVSKVGDKEVKLTLTGVAQRKKAFFKVYTIGSYVEEGVAVHSAEELAHKDCAKQMHLIMQRDVDGESMANAFIEGIRLNYPEPKFAEQCKSLLDFMKSKGLKTGDHVWLTHVTGVGFICRMPGDKEVLIKDVAFAQAIWDIYLGNKNIGDEIKAGLTSRLK